jgi:hypothetical protein
MVNRPWPSRTAFPGAQIGDAAHPDPDSAFQHPLPLHCVEGNARILGDLDTSLDSPWNQATFCTGSRTASEGSFP